MHTLILIVLVIILLFSSLTIQYINGNSNSSSGWKKNGMNSNSMKKVKINTRNNIVANDSKPNKMNNNASISFY